MFLRKKEESSLPDLPPLEVPKTEINNDLKNDFEDNEDETDNEKHSLPSFPDSPIQKGFSQAAIKDAISDEDNSEEELLNTPKDEKAFKTIEMDEWSSDKEENQKSSFQPASLPQKQMINKPTQAQPKKETAGDIFVKIDKFYSAKKSIAAISSKVEEVENLLNKIREIKMREEQELSNWEKDLNLIKSRLKDVTETIFEKA